VARNGWINKVNKVVNEGWQFIDEKKIQNRWNISLHGWDLGHAKLLHARWARNKLCLCCHSFGTTLNVNLFMHMHQIVFELLESFDDILKKTFTIFLWMRRERKLKLDKKNKKIVHLLTLELCSWGDRNFSNFKWILYLFEHEKFVHEVTKTKTTWKKKVHV
jgi:hypothetical protein